MFYFLKFMFNILNAALGSCLDLSLIFYRANFKLFG